EIAVIAVDDERWQERPLAIVVAANAAVSGDQLREFLTDRVARFWIPEYWAFVDSIPKTSVGKIDKKLLRIQQEAGEFDIQYEK
ncbi:MAG TPA: fatty acid--CoA ligase, partial [Kineobactrum sp.]